VVYEDNPNNLSAAITISFVLIMPSSGNAQEYSRTSGKLFFMAGPTAGTAAAGRLPFQPTDQTGSELKRPCF